MPTMDPKDLSLASITDSSVDVDWSEYRDGLRDRYEIVLPEITEAVLDEHAYDFEDWREDYDLEEAAEEWSGGYESYYEWKDGYEPMMNFYWPIHLPYGADPATIAARIDAWAGCVTLIDLSDMETGPDYALALSGGGMDLSGNLAAAYVAAGVVPPLDLLRNLANYADGGYGLNVGDEPSRLILAAMDRAASHLRDMADRMQEDAARRRARKAA